MRNPLSSRRAASQAAAVLVLTLVNSAAAHSWVEWATKVAPNGTLIGDMGYARGYVPRNSTDPLYTDTIPQNILPVSGQAAYSGDEVINKYPKEDNPQFAMLEAAAGDYIALMHLENGHTTLPENQPLKPLNRGTIFLYGSDQPAEQEKLFDVHLLWNEDGTGGDKRGKLLGTRNYDDGQCFQPNSSPLASERVSALAANGAVMTEELACQSAIKLPSDLKTGSVYTIYWYWDWPDLNADAIDIDATSNGKFPWAGTFMRGLKDPNGFTMDAIAKNESYSSVVDIKITGPESESFSVKAVDKDWISEQDVYSMAIKEQMQSNFQVDVGDSGSGGGSDTPAATTTAPAPTDTPEGGGGGVATVTVTATVPPTTIIQTVIKTVPAEAPATSDPAAQGPSTVWQTVTKHVPAGGAQPTETQTVEAPEETQPTDTQTVEIPAATRILPSGTRPEVTPFLRPRRANWGFFGDN